MIQCEGTRHFVSSYSKEKGRIYRFLIPFISFFALLLIVLLYINSILDYLKRIIDMDQIEILELPYHWREISVQLIERYFDSF